MMKLHLVVCACFVIATAGVEDDQKSDEVGSAGGADYQKYYSKYMSQGDDKAQGAQGGDYKKYYSKYMDNKGGGGQGGDYKKYYSQYMSGGGQGGDYQKYYKQYMSHGDDKAGGGQGGDYQKYYSKYMDDKKGGGQGGDYKKYYSKYMSSGPPGAKGGETKSDKDDDVALISVEPKEPKSQSGVQGPPVDASQPVELISTERQRSASRTWLCLAAVLPAAGLTALLGAGKFYRKSRSSKDEPSNDVDYYHLQAEDDVSGYYNLQA